MTLTIGDRCSAVLDDPSASFGNTGLLADHTWPYGATAGPHGAVLLKLRRSRLHDALRGRRDLAAAVAQGFLRTLGRRAVAAHVAASAPPPPDDGRGGASSSSNSPTKLPKRRGDRTKVIAAARADYAAISGSPQLSVAFSPRDAAVGAQNATKAPPFFALDAKRKPRDDDAAAAGQPFRPSTSA